MTIKKLAQKLADKVRATGVGFMTLNKEQLKSELGIGKLTESQAQEIVSALGKEDLFVHPRPDPQVSTLRLYDLRHDIGKAAKAVIRADLVPDTPLHTVARAVQRVEAGRSLRSTDVPWLDAFGIWLELVSGREPDEWEDLNDGRHPGELTRSLAASLNISPDVVDTPWVIHLAATCSAWRPPMRLLQASDLDTAEAEGKMVSRFLRVQKDRASRALLRAAAPLFFGDVEPPKGRVELGLLGLRLRREQHV